MKGINVTFANGLIQSMPNDDGPSRKEAYNQIVQLITDEVTKRSELVGMARTTVIGNRTQANWKPETARNAIDGAVENNMLVEYNGERDERSYAPATERGIRDVIKYVAEKDVREDQKELQRKQIAKLNKRLQEL